MSGVKIYRVYNQSGKYVVEGTDEECAKKLGITAKSFQRAAREFKRGGYKKYYIWDVSDEPENVDQKSERELIEAWDNFVTPIREKYGIPVYKREKGGAK